MKKVLFASSMFAVAAFAAEYKGTISDAGCKAAHADASEKSMKCVEKCVKDKGAAAVLVSDGKVLKIADASKAKVMDHLGHKVVVDGKLDGETLTIDSVKMDH